MPCDSPSSANSAHQRDLGAVELPVAREAAAVLVAVAVADHHVLLGARALHHRGDAGQRVVLAHDRPRALRRSPMVSNSGDDDQVGRWRAVVVERAAHQPALLEQQQHLEQVAHVSVCEMM